MPARDSGPKPKPRADDAHPSGDNRFKMLDATMKRHRFAQDALIEILHTAQELFGYLQPDILYYVAHSLKLPPSRVYGVATFYHFFTFVPKGEHTCVVCTGTACYVKGAARILEAIEGALGTVAGKTTADGRISLSTARCLGACGLAPIVVYDGEVAGGQAAEQALQRLKGWEHDGSR
jgi:bidirectional [NiFe] hydrogenase diaphorase subunit